MPPSTALPGTRQEPRWNRAHIPQDFSIETLRQRLGRRTADQRMAQSLGSAAGAVGAVGVGDRPVVIWRRLRWELLAHAVFVIAAGAIHSSHRPLLAARVAGAGAPGRRGSLLEPSSPVATRSEGAVLAGLGANFLISVAGRQRLVSSRRSTSQRPTTACHYY